MILVLRIAQGGIVGLAHSLIQDYIASLLKYYSFNVTKEYWLGHQGRIDIYAYHPILKKRLGIEISLTSDISHDAEKLATGSLDLRFIITDNRPKGDSIEAQGIKIPIIHYNDFESILRQLLDIPRLHPRFGTLESWLASQKIPSTLTEANKESSVQRQASKTLYSLLEELGLDTYYKRVEKLLLYTYLANELVSKRSRGLDYESTIDPTLLAIVERLRLVEEYAKGSGNQRKYFITLTRKGEVMARSILLEKMSENEEALNNILKRYGVKALLVTIGTLEVPGRLSLRITNEPPVERTLLHLGRRLSDMIMRYYDIILEKYSIDPLLLLLGTFTAYYFYENSLEFYEGLQELGFALKVPVYDSRGRYSWDEYRSSLELLDFIVSHARSLPHRYEEGLEEFGALSLILYAGQYRVERHEFEALAQQLGIKIDLIENLLTELNSRGLTSRYIQRRDDIYPPFVVLKEKEFKNTIVNKLITIIKNI